MSKRHLEPDSTILLPGGDSASGSLCDANPLLTKSESKTSGSACQRTLLGCTSPTGNGTGNLKRLRRPLTLSPFDFSLIKVDGEVTLSSNLPTSAPHLMSPESQEINSAPTKILPFLFLGAEVDALSEEFITKNGITHILNASISCPKSPFVSSENFLRIPVNDSPTEQLLPYFDQVFSFLDACCKANGRALVHCFAGISRSPTLVIAYIMSHLRLSQEDAYRFVKMRRSIVSPNFNFVAQLSEFESVLIKNSTTAPPVTDANPMTFLHKSPNKQTSFDTSQDSAVGSKSRLIAFAQSPTTALAQLSFNKSNPLTDRINEIADKEVINTDKEPDTFYNHLSADDKEIVATTRRNVHERENVFITNQCLSSSNSRSHTVPELQGRDSNQSSQSSIKCDSIMLNYDKTTMPCNSKSDEPIVSRRQTSTDKSSPPNGRRISRPNSIAITSLPFKFDLPSDFGTILSDVADCSFCPIHLFSCKSCPQNFIDQMESACRSRSFNDLSTVTMSRTSFDSGFCSSCAQVPTGNSVIATVPLYVKHVWHTTPDGRTSSSSLSSGNSAKLQGSQEIVQVS